MGEIFLAGIVVIILLVMAEEFFEAYDEWRKDIDDELQYGIFRLNIPHKMICIYYMRHKIVCIEYYVVYSTQDGR